MNVLAATLVAASALLSPNDDKELERLLKRTAYPLSEAVKKALEIARSGTILSVELEDEDGKVVYSVEVAQGSKTVEILLDAKTGELVEKTLEDDDQESLAKACKITLSRAIEIALEKVPGRAYAAEAEIENDKAILEVKIIGDGKVHKVKLDPATGAVLKVKARTIEGEKKEGGKE